MLNPNPPLPAAHQTASRERLTPKEPSHSGEDPGDAYIPSPRRPDDDLSRLLEVARCAPKIHSATAETLGLSRGYAGLASSASGGSESSPILSLIVPETEAAAALLRIRPKDIAQTFTTRQHLPGSSFLSSGWSI